MTYRSNLPPWFAMATPPVNTGLPPLETLAPNPRLAQQPAAQRMPRKRPARPGPQARRAAKRETHAKLVQATQEQPRDSIGQFAEKGKWLTRFFDSTPRPPTRLKPLKRAGEKKHPVTAPPRARVTKRKRKKPVPERSMFGRIVALFNGDYARWRRADLRQRARWRMQAEGHYAPPKKRTRRRGKPNATPAQPPRRRGIVRRILGL